jgi:hypothetical protein
LKRTLKFTAIRKMILSLSMRLKITEDICNTNMHTGLILPCYVLDHHILTQHRFCPCRLRSGLPARSSVVVPEEFPSSAVSLLSGMGVPPFQHALVQMFLHISAIGQSSIIITDKNTVT